jgi:hypothetical protein
VGALGWPPFFLQMHSTIPDPMIFRIDQNYAAINPAPDFLCECGNFFSSSSFSELSDVVFPAVLADLRRYGMDARR